MAKENTDKGEAYGKRKQYKRKLNKLVQKYNFGRI